jgi:hypothetical protein
MDEGEIMTSRVASAALALGILLGGVGVTAGSAGADGSSSAAVSRTRLTFAVTGCEGCEFRLTQALNGRQNVWQSKGKVVTDGTVTWSVPTSRTRGLSVTVLAPWDGGAGYVPTVVFRYAGERVGDAVTKAAARSKRRASSCWAGTTKEARTMRIRVVHASAESPSGEPIKTPRAFTPVTQRWEKPMYRAWRGISGTQDATYCG